MSEPIKQPVVTEPNKEPIKPTEPKVDEPIKPTDSVKKEEPKDSAKEPAKDYPKEIEGLKAEIVSLTETAEKFEATSLENTSLKKDIEIKDTKLKQYEDLVTKLVETKLSQVPEELKDLIPDNLDLTQKLNWLEKAEAKGLFTKPEKKNPAVEIGKPMNIETDTVDSSKLSGSQLLKLAFNTLKK